MKDVTLKYVDGKGEKGMMKMRYDDSINLTEVIVKAFIDGLSNASFLGYTEITETEFETPTVLVSTDALLSDKDLKVNLIFDWPAKFTTLRVSIPCPVMNIEGGIVVRWGESKAFVPAVKLAGEVGKSGNELAAALSTMCAGDTTSLRFMSGSLTKN